MGLPVVRLVRLLALVIAAREACCKGNTACAGAAKGEMRP